MEHWMSTYRWSFTETKAATRSQSQISNFSTVVREHQPRRQLCQKSCGSGRADEEGAALTGSGDVRKGQLDLVDAHGPCLARRGGSWDRQWVLCSAGSGRAFEAL